MYWTGAGSPSCVMSAVGKPAGAVVPVEAVIANGCATAPGGATRAGVMPPTVARLCVAPAGGTLSWTLETPDVDADDEGAGDALEVAPGPDVGLASGENDEAPPPQAASAKSARAPKAERSRKSTEGAVLLLNIDHRLTYRCTERPLVQITLNRKDSARALRPRLTRTMYVRSYKGYDQDLKS
jgi:pyruvate/2-oxoglutarate dehydrogenase complex dihydrolipoamide acyltransferase (E2) component